MKRLRLAVQAPATLLAFLFIVAITYSNCVSAEAHISEESFSEDLGKMRYLTSSPTLSAAPSEAPLSNFTALFVGNICGMVEVVDDLLTFVLYDSLGLNDLIDEFIKILGDILGGGDDVRGTA